MGDRTTVRLRVVNIQAAEVQKYFSFEINCESDRGETTTEFEFYEVNYGTLPFLKELQNAGIAYDSSWDDGDEYYSGTESIRFTPEGGVVTRTLYDNATNPKMDELMPLIDKPDELRAHLLAHKEFIAFLPWDNQEEYGKVYLTKRLISQ